jgi:DNA-binding transcriptional LysR family regulator
MELRQLNYFITISDLKSFTRAAKKLFISQPALTNQMNSLESELGMRLFERTSRSVSLTSAGQTFYLHAQQVIDEVNHTLFEVQKMKEAWQRTLICSVHPLLMDEDFLQFHRGLKTLFPDMTIHFSEEIAVRTETFGTNRGNKLQILLSAERENGPSQTYFARGTLVYAALTEDALKITDGQCVLPLLSQEDEDFLKKNLSDNTICVTAASVVSMRSCLSALSGVAMWPYPLVPKDFATKPLDSDNKELYLRVAGANRNNFPDFLDRIRHHFLSNGWEI